MAALANIIRDLLIFIFLMFAALVVLILVISKLPPDNPLKRFLTAVCWRVGVTLGAGVVAVPVEPIPGLDALYDTGVPIVLVIYWLWLLRDAYRMFGARGETRRL